MYTIEKINWNLLSEQILSVSKNKNIYNIKVNIDNKIFDISLSKEIFNVFKKDFPEHCIDIINLKNKMSEDDVKDFISRWI